MAENFSNMGKRRVTQVHEGQRAPGRINPRKNTPRDNSNQTDKKTKKKILKAMREKQQIIYKVIPIRLSTDFSSEPL